MNHPDLSPSFFFLTNEYDRLVREQVTTGRDTQSARLVLLRLRAAIAEIDGWPEFDGTRDLGVQVH